MKPLKKETATQRRRRMTYDVGDLEPLGRSHITPESALTGTLEQWDDALFKNATVFNVCILTGHGRYSRAVHTYSTFPAAVDMAKRYADAYTKKDADERVLIYANNPDGRHACLPPDRWDHFQQLWLRMHPKFEDQVFQLIEGWYCIVGGKIYGPFSAQSIADHVLKTKGGI